MHLGIQSSVNLHQHRQNVCVVSQFSSYFYTEVYFKNKWQTNQDIKQHALKNMLQWKTKLQIPQRFILIVEGQYPLGPTASLAFHHPLQNSTNKLVFQSCVLNQRCQKDCRTAAFSIYCSEAKVKPYFPRAA